MSLVFPEKLWDYEWLLCYNACISLCSGDYKHDPHGPAAQMRELSSRDTRSETGNKKQGQFWVWNRSTHDYESVFPVNLQHHLQHINQYFRNFPAAAFNKSHHTWISDGLKIMLYLFHSNNTNQRLLLYLYLHYSYGMVLLGKMGLSLWLKENDNGSFTGDSLETAYEDQKLRCVNPSDVPAALLLRLRNWTARLNISEWHFQRRTSNLDTVLFISSSPSLPKSPGRQDTAVLKTCVCVCVWAHVIFQEDLSGCCLFDITRVDRRDDNTVITLLDEWNELTQRLQQGAVVQGERSRSLAVRNAQRIMRPLLFWYAQLCCCC